MFVNHKKRVPVIFNNTLQVIIMKGLLKLDKRFIIFLLFFPFIWDVLFRDYQNNELIQLLWFILIYLWQLGAGKELYKKSSEENTTAFYIFQFILFFLIFRIVYLDIADPDYFYNLFYYAHLTFTITLVLIYGWSVFFISKRLVKLEKIQNINSNLLITFMMIFVLPIGIWWIQPRIQSVIK
jgi:hypothetical protein